MIGPASDGTVEKASAVLAHPSGRSSTSPDSSCPGEDLVVQNHIEQRFMNPDAAVILNKAELTKAIHEIAYA
jgi:hypothetical protein